MASLPLKHLTLTINRNRYHLYEQGAGKPTLVLLHYFAGSGLSWQPMMAGLAAAHCFAPDLRGFGQSAAHATSYQLADYVSDLEELVASLKLARFTLVGHSMGGKIALAYAAQQPPGLERLVLVAPSPPSPEPIPDGERARLLTTHGQREAAEQTLAKIIAQSLPTTSQAQAVADNLRSDPAAWRTWLQQGSREDIAASVGTISIPTLVVSGDEDETIPRLLIEREVMPHLSNGRLVRVAGSSHLLPLEAPIALGNLISTFLA